MCVKGALSGLKINLLKFLHFEIQNDHFDKLKMSNYSAWYDKNKRSHSETLPSFTMPVTTDLPTAFESLRDFTEPTQVYRSHYFHDARKVTAVFNNMTLLFLIRSCFLSAFAIAKRLLLIKCLSHIKSIDYNKHYMNENNTLSSSVRTSIKKKTTIQFTIAAWVAQSRMHFLNFSLDLIKNSK